MSRGWTSREPIVIGNPIPAFEPRLISEDYRRTPYRPDTVLDGWSAGEFSVRGGSVRGYLHRYEGAPRQDDFALAARAGGRQIIAAVADGVSQARQSHIGSTTAVRYACQWLDRMLTEPADATDWKAMVEATAWTLIEQARAIDPDCADAAMAEQMLATTLACAVVEAGIGGGVSAHVISIGDSGAWLLTDSGYQGDQRFNALHGETRLLFFHETGGWQIDVFLGEFSMCHRIDLSRSLLPGRRTIPPADLLLTKLQIVEMNLKDMKDVVAILLDHPVVAEANPEALELARVIGPTSRDWGLYTTVTDSLARVRANAADLLDVEQVRTVEERVTAMTEAMAAAPKSRRWGLRSRIGRRVLWYELPDEVGR